MSSPLSRQVRGTRRAHAVTKVAVTADAYADVMPPQYILAVPMVLSIALPGARAAAVLRSGDRPVHHAQAIERVTWQAPLPPAGATVSAQAWIRERVAAPARPVERFFYYFDPIS